MTSRTKLLPLLLVVIVTFAFGLHLSAQTPGSSPEPTVLIALVGDSTVATDGGWGDEFAKLLKPGVKCVNMGQNGRSSKSYRVEGHWKKVLELKPTWVLIQFGHNDEPGKGPERETDPNTTYRQYMARYIDDARAIGAQPVFVTSMTRRTFDKDGKIKDTLGPYADAVKAVAAEKHVPVIDLHTRSIEFMEKVGPEAAVKFDHASKDSKPDRTHLSQEGKVAMAQLVAAEVKTQVPGLAQYLAPAK